MRGMLYLTMQDEISYITLRTHVRRLRSLSLFMLYLPSHGLPKELIFSIVAEISKKNHLDFLNYISPTGEITYDNGPRSTSLKSYFDAGKSLGLIAEQGNTLIKTRLGEVYPELPQNNIDNFYYITAEEKLFFLFAILRRDFDYFIPVLGLLFTNKQQKLDFYLTQFHTAIKDWFISKATFSSKFMHPAIAQILVRINNWQSAKKYAEDIVPPRINWLLDLGLLDAALFKSGILSLNSQGILLYEFLLEKSNFTKEWVFKEYFSVSSTIFFTEDFRLWESLDQVEKEIYLERYFLIAINKFSVPGIPRLSVEQTLYFFSYLMLKENHVIVNFTEVLTYIGFERTFNRIKILYRKAERAGESYFLVLYA